MQQSPSAGAASGSVIVVLPRYHIITRKQLPILGVIQMIVALIVMVLGILRATQSQNLVSDSLVYIWGPVMFIIAGCMTIYDGTSQRPKIKSAVVVNAAAGVASLVTVIIFFLDVFETFNTSDPWKPDLDMSSRAFSGFSAILCLLELTLCGCSAGIGKPGGCCDPTLQHYGNASLTVQTPPTNLDQPTVSALPISQAPPSYLDLPTGMVPAYRHEKPPDYSSIVS